MNPEILESAKLAKQYLEHAFMKNSADHKWAGLDWLNKAIQLMEEEKNKENK